MNKIRCIFADKEPNKSFVIVLLLICIIIPLLFSGIVWLDWQRTRILSSEEIVQMTVQSGPSNVNGEVNFYFDNIASDKSEIITNGWAIQNEVIIGYVNISIVLYNPDLKTYIKIPTRKLVNGNLDSAFGEGYNYSQGGFYSVVNKSKLDKNTDYELCILYRSGESANSHSNILVHTGLNLGGINLGIQS